MNPTTTPLTDETFSEATASGLTLVDFWAPWCGPCRVVGPVVEELGTAYAGRVKVAKVNVDENPELAAQFRIQSIPTLLLLKNGQSVDSMVGAHPKAAIARMLEQHLNPSASG
ncbi:thioredoxin [Deinococcus peraridilitoris]|uniref:Thioredoxin n=1 Tax=Deinococcus peraridilitoris (strain DSM 19664 / LMG 22246 / CIP 109416 / KR-200) TaxID=937777 RepID=L0A5X7_DEIPD|nr:thioredoxin [Deinococcus peraridilitoris]AFZ69288.1 thioredoxin [Deinococcus peraridilitoris DSM 19664]